MDWYVEYHSGNPGHMARVVGPTFRTMPICEGGGWYTDPETARMIAAAPNLLSALVHARDVLVGIRDPEARADRDRVLAEINAAISSAA